MLTLSLERNKEREKCLLEGTRRTPVPKPPFVQERKQATCVPIKCVLPYQRLKVCPPPKQNKHKQKSNQAKHKNFQDGPMRTIHTHLPLCSLVLNLLRPPQAPPYPTQSRTKPVAPSVCQRSSLPTLLGQQWLWGRGCWRLSFADGLASQHASALLSSLRAHPELLCRPRLPSAIQPERGLAFRFHLQVPPPLLKKQLSA